MTSVELVRANARNAWSRDVNQLVDRDRGNLGGYILLRGYDGTRRDAAKGGTVLASGQYPLDVQSPLGKHAAFVHSSAAPTALPTPANAVVLITDDGLGLGAGKGLRVYDAAGVDYSELTADIDGGLVVAGSGLGAGNLTLVGTGRRIMGDMTNATAASRLSLQSNVLNGMTYPGIIPNGTSQIAGIAVYAGSNPAAAAYGDLLITNTELRLYSGHTGAAYLPFGLYTGGLKRINVDISGGIQLLGATTVTLADPPTANAQVTAQSQCKAWAYVTGGGGATLGDNYNCASVSRTATGAFTIVWDRDFANTTYALVVTIQTAAAALMWRVNSQAVGSADLLFFTTGSVPTDPTAFSVCAFGTLV